LKNHGWISALLILLGLTICVPIPVVSVTPVPPVVPPSGTFEKFGPRVYDLLYLPCGDPLREATALENEEIDTMDWPVPGAYVNDWLADPEITMGNYSEWEICGFALNNQMWPIGHGTMTPVGWTGNEPAVQTGHYWINYTCQRCLDTREFRRALAHLVDRNAIATHMMGFATAVETYIFPDIKDWENPAAPRYAYSLVLAKARLDAGGFKDYDGDKKLEYHPVPAIRNAWSRGQPAPAGTEELPILQMWIRVDDPDLRYAAELLRDEMLLQGIPLDAHYVTRSMYYYHAWVAYDYHIIPTRWRLDREPDMYYHLFHSEKDTYSSAGADNNVRYHSQEFDPVGEALHTAPNLTAAMEACYQAQMIVHRDVAAIPAFTPVGYTAHRTYYGNYPGEEKYAGREWEGFINELGVGFSNFWSFLNVHPQGFEKGGTLRQGMSGDIDGFNPVHAEWSTDWLVLNEIYEPLVKYHPYNATEYVPWLAESYEVGTWEKPGVGTCTKIRFHVFPALFHDDEIVDAYDVAFTFQYLKDQLSIAWYWAVIDFDHAEVIDRFTVDIFYDCQSVWALSWCRVPILPKHIWEGKDASTWNPEDHDAVIGTGPFRCLKDLVVGRPDHVPSEYVHLVTNPTYFRRLIWPDVCDKTHTPSVVDGWVDLDDFMEAAIHFFEREDPDGNWPSAWGEYCDVNKDGRISPGDLLEIGIHYAEPWPPERYVDC